MGIPYSREINAAFEQVTPLVAAGFQVLKTTRNISILLAVIQVLTVVLLGLILGVLVALVYVLDPGLEHERDTLVTPLFKRAAQLTFWGMIESFAAAIVGFAGFLVIGLFLSRARRQDHIESAAEEESEEALEGVKEGKEEESKEEAGEKKKKKRGKKGKGKGKEGGEGGKEEEENGKK